MFKILAAIFDTDTLTIGAASIATGVTIEATMVAEPMSGWMQWSIAMGWIGFAYLKLLLKQRKDKKKAE